MSETKIEWAHFTQNWWVGCTKISAACDHCYAESWAKRGGAPELWQGERRRTTAANWRKPYKWDAEAARLGVRYRVFTNSLADFFDNQVPDEWRTDAWRVIAETPNLDWMLLTKRPQNIRAMLPGPDAERPWGMGWPNVWLGATVENQQEAERRIPHLLHAPAIVHFLSMEPLLGPVDLEEIAFEKSCDCVDASPTLNAFTGDIYCPGCCEGPEQTNLGRVDGIIVGGESGGHARPMHPQWPRELRLQCARNEATFHFKQWGEWREAQSSDDAFDTGKGRAQKTPAFIVATDGTVHCFLNGQTDRNSRAMLRVGKTAAGRLLDGVQYDELPAGGVSLLPR